MWPVRVRDRVGRLNQWKSYLVLASMFIVILVAIHLTHYDNAYKKLIMTRQLYSGDSKQEELIREYFEIFADSLLFGKCGEKIQKSECAELLTLVMNAEHVIFDMDEIIGTLNVARTDYVLNPEFVFLARKILKSSDKHIYIFTSNQDKEFVEQVKDKIQRDFIKEDKIEIVYSEEVDIKYDAQQGKWIKWSPKKSDPRRVKDLNKIKALAATDNTVVIDDCVDSWMLNFKIDLPERKKKAKRNSHGQIDKRFPSQNSEVFDYYDPTFKKTKLIWSRVFRSSETKQR